MNRLPIRLRLTLTFTAAVAVVFVCAGAFLYLRLQHTLDAGIRSSLQAQASQVTALVRQADNGLRQGGTSARSDSFAQVLTSSGSVYDASPTLPPRPLLTAKEVRRALDGQLVVDRSVHDGSSGADRLLAVPVSAQGQRLVVVVGAALADRNQALDALLYQLLLGGPAALALVALAGHLLARAALRPVERMRSETQRMSGAVSPERVTLPPADDEIRRLGSTLNDLLERLELSVQRERRFAADASHELRTPLALLRTELELALRRPRSVDDLVAAIRSAAAETDRVAELAEGLLVLARADSANLALARRPVPSGQLLVDVAERYCRRAAEQHRRIVVEDAFEGVVTVDAPGSSRRSTTWPKTRFATAEATSPSAPSAARLRSSCESPTAVAGLLPSSYRGRSTGSAGQTTLAPGMDQDWASRSCRRSHTPTAEPSQPRTWPGMVPSSRSRFRSHRRPR